MRISKKVCAVVAAPVAAMAIATMAMAGPASASVSGDYASNGVYIRTGPSTSYTALGLGYPGQGSTLSCYKSGQNINGNPYWDYNKNKRTSVTGYSADYYMSWYGTLYPC